MDQFTKGICSDMCPRAEIDLRIRERMVHFFETDPDAGRPGVPDRYRMVKEFTRSAAGVRQPKPSDIRTPRTLLETVHYLLTFVLPDSRRPYYERYEFIFDRMRAVRQEMVIQNLPPSEVLPILEPIVRFLCYSAYRLCEAPIREFDPKICGQHLQECLKKVLRCYEEVDTALLADNNRYEMERLYLSFNIGSPEATQWAIDRYRTVHPALNLHVAVQLDCLRGNYYAAMQRAAQFAPLEAAIASLQLPAFRRKLLQQFSVAYQSRVQTVPLEWLETVLQYDGRECFLLADDCRHYNLQVVSVPAMQGASDDNGEPVNRRQGWAVKFEKSQFDAQRSVIPSRKVLSVDRALDS
ncbi:SAC3 domain-containing protein 1 [Anopheles cruzii]|uniref:SAC3 domain-containing protein 1 n=1 Tax=Anopheles cruzii TaxID=68878 RepID=UPI0022EC2E02|nr:SAC3 domain-containing protein 1 [Anopheles cruzii]